MVNCQSCIFWREDKSKGNQGWGDCSLTRSTFGKPAFERSFAVAQDYESYEAWLRTHHTFACNQGRSS